MNIQVLTLFPELFEPFTKHGLMSRAVSGGIINLSPHQLRSFAINAHGQVDDTPYGGGSGMVLRPEPAIEAIRSAKTQDPQALTVLLTPRGKPLTQPLARSLVAQQSAKNSGFIVLCSRYEGVDERIAEHYIDLEVSMGDFILMGGEIPAMAFIEVIVRLLTGVLGNPESLEQESFERGLLEYPQYTKPQEYEQHKVPPVLLTGNHGQINEWRKEQALRDTAARRPDLLGKLPPKAEVCIALVHFPVTDKNGLLVTSSITNIDLHDISRTAKTFGISRFYAIHPVKTLRRLAQRISDHWQTGYGATYNPNRSEALEHLSVVPDLDDCLLDIEQRCGRAPRIVTTSAKQTPSALSFEQFRAELAIDSRPHLILLGTGWGLAQSVLDRAELHLEPICGPGDYNHLSVRSAAAIICDRLFGN